MLIVFIVIVVVVAAGVAYKLMFGTDQPVPGPVFVRGDGTFDQEIVGEASYQDALIAIAGAKSDESAEFEAIAVLVPEPNNPYDADAVCVQIDGKVVGYLSRSDAKLHRQALSEAGLGLSSVACRALIVGGWAREDDDEAIEEVNYGVELDLVYPLKK